MRGGYGSLTKPQKGARNTQPKGASPSLGITTCSIGCRVGGKRTLILSEKKGGRRGTTWAKEKKVTETATSGDVFLRRGKSCGYCGVNIRKGKRKWKKVISGM